MVFYSTLCYDKPNDSGCGYCYLSPLLEEQVLKEHSCMVSMNLRDFSSSYMEVLG